jgi:hypothetical protein
VGGGAVDIEYCCEFGANERVMVLAYRTSQSTVITRRWFGRSRTRHQTHSSRRLFEFTGEEMREEPYEQQLMVLTRMLKTFGIDSGAYFKPHTREFDWSQRKIL